MSTIQCIWALVFLSCTLHQKCITLSRILYCNVTYVITLHFDLKYRRLILNFIATFTFLQAGRYFAGDRHARGLPVSFSNFFGLSVSFCIMSLTDNIDTLRTQTLLYRDIRALSHWTEMRQTRVIDVATFSVFCFLFPPLEQHATINLLHTSYVCRSIHSNWDADQAIQLWRLIYGVMGLGPPQKNGL